MTESYQTNRIAAPANPVQQAKEKKQILEDFFKTIKDAARIFSAEEIDMAMQELKFSALEIREIQERKRREEEAARAEEIRRQQQARREAAARRAAARKQKQHLEHVKEITAMDLPMDWVNPYDADERANNHVESIADGLMMSLDYLGMVDIEFISSVTGADYKSVIESLRGSIYQNPLFWNECFYKGWETADEYLSGNLMHKHKIAKAANEKYNGYFEANVTALEALIEPNIDVDNIYVTLGSPWVPTDIIDDFILHLIGEEPVNGIYNDDLKQYFAPEYAVRHDDYTGIWEIPNKTRFRTSRHHGRYEEINYSVFGTDRMDMLYLLENILNMKTLTVTDAKDKSGNIRVINNGETVKLLEKQEKMIKEFQDWVWTDDNRRARLQAAYCRKYGNIRKRTFNGSFLQFPGMSDKVSLFDYQKNSVARILMSPNTLLAHDVGAGKTYVMVAAGMELRRLGKSKKNLYVVPNNILGQWKTIFLEMYPDANLLMVDNRNFNIHKRAETLQKIRDENYDGIIMAYSCFDMLSLSRKYYSDLYKHQLEMIEKATRIFYSDKKLDRRKKAISDTLEKLHKETLANVCEIPFDDLGINTLFVDEAHNYKNVGIETNITRVLGGGGRFSAKARGMMDKVHCVQRQNNGGRVIMATGTPIT
ncbi:MAG: DEAD/DEAH box helicase family protein, partial [Erysipelotrichaceae bacterium]|nr:DEAD/DEAH box helicase family protein [Erysipelotrichaceae bacterium]